MTSPAGGEHLVAVRRALKRAAPAIARPLPWVGCGDPWAIVVSEFMLQQTQTSRVIGPWQRFLERFPTPADGAGAPLGEVLRLWEGLGFHRRAKFLHDTAKAIRDQWDGEVPSSAADLRTLPGVGAYTANAIASFAFGAPTAVLDTNVGRILARAVANRRLESKEAQSLVDELVPNQDSALFNQALLDLGAQFCTKRPQCEVCPLAGVCRWRLEGGDDPAPSSAGVSKAQSTFEGSARQLRGRVLALLRTAPCTEGELAERVANDPRLLECLAGLEHDGLITRRARRWCLVGDVEG